MASISEQIASINESVNKINQAAGDRDLQKLSTLPAPPAVLSSQTLADQPQIDVTNQQAPSFQADALSASIQSFAEQQQEQFTRGLEKEAGAAQTGVSQSLDDLFRQFETSIGAAEAQAIANQEFEVEQRRQELNDLNNQILREQVRARRAIEKIQQEGGGLKMGAQSEIRNIQRDSAAFQADLAITQMAAQGRFDSAQREAERKAAALFEQSQRELDFRKFVYGEYKDLFEKTEQRAFEARQSQVQRQLDQEQRVEAALQSVKLDALKMAQTNGAPVGVLQAIQTAKTPEDVLVAGGQWASADMLDRMYKQAQIANIYDTINARAQAARTAASEATTKKEAEKEQLKADTEQALGIRELASQLLADDGLSSAVGFGFKKSIIGRIPFVSGEAVEGTKRADFEAVATRLANMLTLDNLDLMSGVLSETDIKILESAGSNLGNFNQSEEQYRLEIQRVLDVANRVIDEVGLTEEQAAFWEVVEQSDISDINLIYN